MKPYVLLLCFCMVFAKPADEESNPELPVSDEAIEFLKSMHGKVDEILTDFVTGLGEAAKTDEAIQAALAELLKPKYLELRQKAWDSEMGKKYRAEAEKYHSILLFSFRDDLLSPLNDLAIEHPGVEPSFGSYTLTHQFQTHLQKLSRLIEAEEILTEFHKRKSIPPNIALSKEFRKLYRYYDSLKVEVEMSTFFFLRDLQIRKHLVDTGALKEVV